MTLNEIVNKRGRISWYAGILLSALFMYVAVGYELGTPTNTIFQYAGKMVFIAIVFIGTFLLFYMKKGSVIRLILFSGMALIFSISFMTSFFLVRGHIGFTENDLSAGIPFCHIALVNNFLSVPFLKTFVNPSNLAGHYAIYPMILIWFWATILVGKGWCSWGCFYGGWDSFSSSLRKKPLLTIKENTSKKLRYTGFGLLFVVALSSTMLFVPVFCSYLCPFKTITEFQQVTGFVSWVTFMVTVVLFFGTCVIFPFLFGRRIWCTYLCPFGAFQSLAGKVFRVFKVKIDKDKCTGCGKCIRSCKTCGITEDSLEKGKTTSNCSLCGICIEQCPKNAINMSVFGNTSPPSVILDKIIRTGENTAGSMVKKIFLNFADDMLQPLTLLYFFGLTVFFNFFTGFYFDLIKNIEFILKGITNG